MKNKIIINTKMGLEKFVFMEDTIEALDIAYELKRNIILTGNGGFGKSHLSEDFLKEKGEQPFVFNLGSGTSVDRLLGGIDIQEYKASGKLEFLVENSWMNHKYVIFEEMLDTPEEILEQLKDILSSKQLRLGGQLFPIKTEMIIACTNRTRKTFAKTSSTKALLERFPFEHEVKWPNFSAKSYNKLFTTRFPKANIDPIVAEILEQYSIKGTGHEISPRIALLVAETFTKKGVNSLKYVADLNSDLSILTKVLSIAQIKREIAEIGMRKEELVSALDIQDASSITSTNHELQLLVTKAKVLKVNDDTMNLKDSLIRDLEETIANNKKMKNIFDDTSFDDFAEVEVF